MEENIGQNLQDIEFGNDFLSRSTKPQNNTTYSLEWLKLKRLTIPTIGENVKQMHGTKLLWKQFGSLLQSNLTLTIHFSAISLLGIYPRETKTYVPHKTCI